MKYISVKIMRKIKKNNKIYDILKILLPYKLRWLILNYKRVKQATSKKYDLVSIGGGQLVLSNETFAIALFIWVWFLYHSGSKNIILLSVGVGDKFSFLDKILFKLALQKIKNIYVRDSRSEKNLKSIFKIDAIKTYDIAFYHPKEYTKSNKNNILLGITDYNVYIKYNSMISRQDYYHSWIKIIEKLPSDSCIKLFYTTQSDFNECLMFQEYCQSKLNIKYDILQTTNLTELYIALSDANTVISGRMHALILAYNLKKKIIVYPISNKLISFNDEIIISNLKHELIQNNLALLRHSIFNQYIK